MARLSLFLIGVLKNVINLFSVLLESQWKGLLFPELNSYSTLNAVMKIVIRLSLKSYLYESSPVTKIIVYFSKTITSP
jgi:hypothetical protein